MSIPNDSRTTRPKTPKFGVENYRGRVPSPAGLETPDNTDLRQQKSGGGLGEIPLPTAAGASAGGVTTQPAMPAMDKKPAHISPAGAATGQPASIQKESRDAGKASNKLG